MKTFGFKSLLIAGLFVAVSAMAPASAHAGPSLCNGAPNGILDGDEQCETGACCTVKCELKSAGTVCRPSADGTCDVAETCGELAPVAEAACPADVVSENGTSCDDGLFCTIDDVCTDGVCTGPANPCDDGGVCSTGTCNEKRNRCEVETADDGTPCDDGNACTSDDTCSAGACEGGTATVCEDENACTDDSCDAETGECVFTDNTAPCDDGLFCTVDDTCSAGACGGAPNACDDGDACSIDSCDEETDSCSTSGSAEDGTACDDGQFCTVDDTCQAGTCTGGGANSCDDENDCTADSCKEANDSCTNTKVSNGSACDDGNACTADDTCGNGVCQGGTETVCEDDNLCTDNTCNPENGECVFVDNTAPCDDGQFCTAGDACSLGACVGGTASGCDDGDACTVDTCDEETDSCGTSGSAEDGTPCDDGLFCTLDDVCTAGECSGATPNTCDDANDCTKDSCNEGSDSCKYSPTNNNGPCEDGSFCTVDDTCSTGECIGAPRNCDDENLCTDDSCNDDTDTCDNLNNSAPCDDGLFCTSGDTCGGGTCSVNTATCNDGNVCTTDSCDEEADSCGNVNNTDPCEDGLFCTVSDACADGACVAGPARDCGDDNACTDDSCNDDTDTCDNVNNTDPCDDGLYCTDVDACSGGTCSGSARDCGDGNECTDDSCNELGDTCENMNNSGACDDGSFCTAGDACVDGACVPGTGDTCDDENVCTDDECDEEADSCSNENNTEDCDDGNICTDGDVCADGVCVPGEEDPTCETTTTTTNTTSTTLCPENLCGDYNGNCEITASDALGILQAAVGIHGCPLVVCDYTGDGKVSAIDALAVLRAAVELPSNPMCPE